MNLKELVTAAHSMAVNKGWWPYPTDAQGNMRLPADAEGAKLALIHSEVSEALEAVRNGDTRARVDPNGKPEGLPSELADIVIRVADYAGACGIDLDAAVVSKLAYNARRIHRHGGRRL